MFFSSMGKEQVRLLEGWMVVFGVGIMCMISSSVKSGASVKSGSDVSDDLSGSVPADFEVGDLCTEID